MAFLESSEVINMVYNSVLLPLYSPNNLPHQRIDLERSWSKPNLQTQFHLCFRELRHFTCKLSDINQLILVQF